MKNWILAVALAVIAIAPAGYFAYNMNPRSGEGSSPTIATIQFEEQQRNFVLEPGAVFGVRSVKVVDGYKFGLYLDQKYGEGTSEELHQRAMTIVKLSRIDYEEAIAIYQKKVNEL